MEVTIPYPYGIFLDFRLEDGTLIRFDYLGDAIWFDSRDFIYQLATREEDVQAFNSLVALPHK